ncbi:hypothetical protein B0H34DRAFT_509091 [Crassisporium funariophilum]|nr:hypothetical protein B0H34DRAFT_509091 [Crassisporium funariophilum]
MPPPRLPVVKPQASGVQSAIKLDPDYSTEFDAFDSVGFGSDDSVFFALADLGPPIDQEDVGRPIQTDGDEGRPINQDEGLMESMNDDSDEGPAAAQAPMPKSNATAPSRHELIAAALMSSGNEESNGNSSPSDSRQGQPSNVPVKSTTSVPATAGMLTKPLLPKPVLATSATVKSNHSSHLQSHTNSNASSSTARFMPPQQQNNQGSKSHVQQQHQRYMIMKQEQIQNQTSSTDSATSGEAVKRPATPSIGGFNFPPNANNPLQNVPGAHSTSSGIGVKRPAEAMGSTSYRGGRPGMGLQQPAPPGPSTVNGRREVFGRLDVGEGGDVKRMRR